MFDLEKFLAADNNLICIRRINNIPRTFERVFKIKAVFYYVKLTSKNISQINVCVWKGFEVKMQMCSCVQYRKACHYA